MIESIISVFLIIILVTIVSLCIFISNKNNTDSIIPKIIWTYWHNDDIPPIIEKCIRTWKVFNPDYKIVILTEKKLKDLYDIDLSKVNINKDFHARIADYVRLHITYKFGGIWMDASIICTKSLDWIHDAHDIQILGYKPPFAGENDILIETWFFAAPKNSKFLYDWIQQMEFMLTFNTECEFVNFIKQNNQYNIGVLEEHLPYLAIHLCASIIIQKNNYKMILFDTVNNGPFTYLHKGNWNTLDSLHALCSIELSPLIKFRGMEREYIIDKKFDIDCTKYPLINDIINS